ncbi:MAG TPA: T9SS type A sorting domain-containing protein [Prolixibacteraceae bacterium]|jgi:hypothetical protein
MKRITNVLLFLILLSNILSAQTHLPTFKYLSISPQTVNNDESIDITINAYDSIYGISKVAVSIYDPQNQFMDQVIGNSSNYLGNNIYTMKYHISKLATSGVYHLTNIEITNNANNTSSHPILYYFTVVSSIHDVTPPVLSHVKVYPADLNSLDTLTCEFEAQDDVSGLAFIWANLSDVGYQILVSNIHFFNAIESLGNNRFRLKAIIPDQAIKGYLHLSLRIFDKADNEFDYDDTTKIFVNGLHEDVTPPNIRSVKVFPDTITISDTLHIMIEAEDTESGIKLYDGYPYPIVQLIDGKGNYWTKYYNLLQIISPNKYLVTIPYDEIDQESIKNENSFVRVSLIDNVNNAGSYIDSKKVFIQSCLPTNSVFFSKDGGNKRFYESGRLDWSISCDADWLTVTRSTNQIIISAKTNPTQTVRYSTIKVSDTGVKDHFINVTQGIYPTGTNELDYSAVSVFPNPVSKTLYLNGLTAITSVAILDLNGKIVIPPQITRDRIDVSNLRNGIYLIKFSGKKGAFITKFIKQ